MAEEMNANERFKAKRSKVLAGAVLITLLILSCAWVFWPPMTSRPYVPLQRKSIEVANVKTEDYNIPPPPEEEIINAKDIPKQNVELKVTGDGPKISADDIGDQGKQSITNLNKDDGKKDTGPAIKQKPKLIPPSEGQARIINKVKPRFPASAAAMNFEGQTVILVTVGADGKVSQVQIIKPSGNAECDQAAIAAMHASTFKPYTFGGKSYPFQFTYQVDWKLIK